MITTKMHGYLDYIMGIVLILFPWIFALPSGAATIVPIVLGAGTILYSLMTDYELGIAKVISMKTHLGIDMVAGLFLILTPWLFGFAEFIFWPFVIFGILEVGASLMTIKKPHYPKVPTP